MLSLAELRGQVYTGGAGGLGRRLCGGVQHQRPHFLYQRKKHPAADSRGTNGQLQRVRSTTVRVFYYEVNERVDRGCRGASPSYKSLSKNFIYKMFKSEYFLKRNIFDCRLLVRTKEDRMKNIFHHFPTFY